MSCLSWIQAMPWWYSPLCAILGIVGWEGTGWLLRRLHR
jgi:hypothetical protein